jgi:hypothetical protein
MISCPFEFPGHLVPHASHHPFEVWTIPDVAPVEKAVEIIPDLLQGLDHHGFAVSRGHS